MSVSVCLCQCVKALVYINQDDLLDVNARNDFGDTALHLAAKWGYGESVWLTVCPLVTLCLHKKSFLSLLTVCGQSIKIKNEKVELSNCRLRDQLSWG